MSANNNIVLIGRLGKEPELKKTTGNNSVLNISLAVTRAKQKDVTDWISVVLWRQSAEFISQYAHKGDLISVAGELQTRSYEKDGQKIYVTEVHSSDAAILSHSEREQRRDDKTSAGNVNRAQNVNNSVTEDFLKDVTITEDDLPF